MYIIRNYYLYHVICLEEILDDILCQMSRKNLLKFSNNFFLLVFLSIKNKSTNCHAKIECVVTQIVEFTVLIRHKSIVTKL